MSLSRILFRLLWKEKGEGVRQGEEERNEW